MRETVTGSGDRNYRPANTLAVNNCTRAAKFRIWESAEIIDDTGDSLIRFTNPGVRFFIPAFASEHAAK